MALYVLWLKLKVRLFSDHTVYGIQGVSSLCFAGPRSLKLTSQVVVVDLFILEESERRHRFSSDLIQFLFSLSLVLCCRCDSVAQRVWVREDLCSDARLHPRDLPVVSVMSLEPGSYKYPLIMQVTPRLMHLSHKFAPRVFANEQWNISWPWHGEAINNLKSRK